MKEIIEDHFLLIIVLVAVIILGMMGLTSLVLGA